LIKKLSFLLVFFLPVFAFAQPVADSIAFDVSTMKDKAGIEKKTFVFVDEKGILHPDGASAQTFRAAQWLFPAWMRFLLNICTCLFKLKFTLRNPSDKPDTIHFYPGFAIDKLNAYKADAAGRLSSFYNDASSGLYSDCPAKRRAIYLFS
jgi:hypothetical protein